MNSSSDLVPLSEGGALMKASCIRDWELWVKYLLGDKLAVTSLSVEEDLKSCYCYLRLSVAVEELT